MKHLLKSAPIFLICVLISACGPGKLFGSASTLMPTNSLTPASTFTPTPTTTPTLTATAIFTPTLAPTLTATPRISLSGENIEQWKIFQSLGGVSGVDIAFTPDGKSIAVGKNTGIQLYNADSLQVQKTILTNNPVLGLRISSDGNVLLAIDNNQNVQRYQLPSGEAIGNPILLKNITGFCPKGQILSAYNWWWTRMFCLPEQTARFTSSPTVQGLITMTFNSDATLALLGGQYGFELVGVVGGQKTDTKWDTSKLTPEWGTAASFSPDGQNIAAGFENGLVFIMNVGTGEKLAQYEIGGEVTGINYNLDGSLLAVTSTTGSAVINMKNGEVDEIGGISPGIVYDMAFSPDGNYLLIVNEVGKFMLWNVVDGTIIFQWQGKPCQIDDVHFRCYYAFSGVAFSPDGKLLALGDNGTVQIIDSSTGEILHEFVVGQVRSLAFSPDGSHIAVSTFSINKGVQKFPDGIQLWGVNSGKLIQTIPVEPCNFSVFLYNCTDNLSFTPDGQVLIASSQKGISLWDLTTFQQTQNWFNAKLESNGFELSTKLSSDGKLLAATGGVTVKLWTVNGHEIAPNAFGIIPCSCSNVDIDPTGRLIGAGHYESTSDQYVLNIWNVADQKLLGSISESSEVFDRDPFRVAFSPKGDVLAIGVNGSIHFYAVNHSD